MITDKLADKVEKMIQGLQQNILATLSLSITLILVGVIGKFTFNGVNAAPLNPSITEATGILLGLPLYAEVALKAIKSDRNRISEAITRNRALFTIVLIPFLVYIARTYPIGNPVTSILYFTMGYVVALLSYGVYIVTQALLRDVTEEVDFVDRLLFASLPSVLITTIMITILSYTARVIGVGLV